jgi:carboxypeptidase D
MLSVLSAALLLACTTPNVVSQFVAPPKGLTSKTGYANVTVRYKPVPVGTCELDPNVKSYSGYADVEDGQHIFWWFFETRTGNASEAPLTTWINGGPGSSSMIGLFQEQGPCRISADGTVVSNPYAWNNVSNMLFIDQPTQVGFSYSSPVPAYLDPNSGFLVQLPNNSCPDYAADWDCGTYSYFNESLTASSTPEVAPNFWKTLQGFMGAFPQYARHGVYFTTESYGGHYGPIISEYMEEQNAKHIDGAHNVSLQGLVIGNGWYDPLVQYQAYYNFTVYPGNTYNYDPFNQSVKDQMYNNLYGAGNCVDQTNDCYARGIDEICSAADNFCFEEVENLYDIYLNRDEYDVRELMPDAFPPEFYVDYLNTAAVQAAIGAYVNFTESSTPVGNAFGSTGDDDRLIGTVAALQKLHAQGVPIVMYHGDADYNCNWLGGQVVSNHVGAPGFSSAGYTNISTADGLVHGQVKQSGDFAFVRIYESGHEVPFYQPLAALQLLNRTLHRVDIATGKTAVTSSYKTTGPKLSTFIEGNSTIQFSVVPPDTIYNTTTNAPNNYTASTADSHKAKTRRARNKRSIELGGWVLADES